MDWRCFEPVLERRKRPELTLFHTRCFNADAVDPLLQRASRPERPTEVVRLIKNVHQLPELVSCELQHRVVSPRLRDILASCCKVDFRPAVVERAWRYPCAPGDGGVGPAGPHPLSVDGRLDLSAMISRFEIEPPKLELYEVVDRGFRLHPSESRNLTGWYFDAQLLTIIGDGTGLGSGTRLLSRHLLEETGLYYNWGFFCTPSVLEKLQPFLTPYYFWSGLPNYSIEAAGHS